MRKRTIIHYNLTVINHDIVSRGLTTYTVILSDGDDDDNERSETIQRQISD